MSVAIFVSILALVSYSLLSTPGNVHLANVPTRFTVNGHAFAITYVAADEGSRERGLMNIKVTNTTTMLFVFPSPGEYSFWMSGVNSSLDIIWLSVTGEVGRVVYIAQNVPACNSSLLCPDYQPTSSANYVLETKGGFANANAITVGSEIEFS